MRISATIVTSWTLRRAVWYTDAAGQMNQASHHNTQAVIFGNWKVLLDCVARGFGTAGRKVFEGWIPLGYDSVSIGKLWKNCGLSWTAYTLTMKEVNCSEMSVTIHQSTRRHVLQN